MLHVFSQWRHTFVICSATLWFSQVHVARWQTRITKAAQSTAGPAANASAEQSTASSSVVFGADAEQAVFGN